MRIKDRQIPALQAAAWTWPVLANSEIEMYARRALTPTFFEKGTLRTTTEFPTGIRVYIRDSDWRACARRSAREHLAQLCLLALGVGVHIAVHSVYLSRKMKHDSRGCPYCEVVMRAAMW